MDKENAVVSCLSFNLAHVSPCLVQIEKRNGAVLSFHEQPMRERETTKMR